MKRPKGRPTKFLPENRAAVIARLEVGQTLRKAAEAADLRYPTVQGWVARGRREGSGEYADFARAVAEATDQPKLEAMTPEEHRIKVSEVARKGNVQALKLYWEMIRADLNADEDEEKQQDPLAGVDQLAAQRAKRTVGA